MKLLNQTQYVFLWAAAPIFALAGAAMYFVLIAAVDDFTEENLTGRQSEIEAYVRLHDTLPVFFQSQYNRLEVGEQPVAAPFPASISDTLLYNNLEAEREPFRRLNFPVKIRGQWRRVTLAQSTLEHEDLAATVALLLGALFGVFFGVLLWVNRRVARRVWQPFFNTLDRMRRFRLADTAPLQLAPTPVDEFGELNRTLEDLTDQVQRDFRMVKQFTENASHELQTPLAVIQSKVEMLLQAEGLPVQQAGQLQIIAQSARRMARLNESLLLLTKIENDQFPERRRLNWQPLVEKRLRWLEDFILQKQLQSTTRCQPVWVDMNPVLADTLVTNLLTNAVKYNQKGGMLEVQLDESGLTVSNSGEPPETPPETLSGRFARGHHQSDGLGLGLSIVTEICAKNDFAFRLGFEAGIWTAIVLFAPVKQNTPTTRP